MARGWESKSVEAQQAEAQEPENSRARMTSEEAARWREKESLRLSRQRVLQQLALTSNPRHRQVLEHALADLDQKLGKFEI